MNMNKDHKAVYAAAAETVGMLLALLSATEKGKSQLYHCKHKTLPKSLININLDLKKGYWSNDVFY